MSDSSTRRDFLKASAAGSLSLALGGCASSDRSTTNDPADADMIVVNGQVTTMDDRDRTVSAFAIRDGRFVLVGDEAEVRKLRTSRTQVIDAGGRRIIPGLIDSHVHVIRGGLHYNMEMRWDAVTSLADALDMLRAQAARTPAPQWVRVVGGWNELQFKERRLPTLDEINAAAPDTPVFILHLYDRALLNRAALRVVGYTKETPDPPGGVIERYKNGEPTGLLIAKPNAYILYKTLSLGPTLSPEDQENSSRHFMRELNRLGVTSCCDAGGGFQNYPDDYRIIEKLHRDGAMTVRVAYNLFTQKPKEELSDFAGWAKLVRPGHGDDLYRLNGAGEMLVYSAADFEDFREPRPDLEMSMESELEGVVRLLAEQRWPFRLHATYDESITRFLNVLETVHRDVPLDKLRWFFDHAETVSQRNLERISALGGGIAVQHRMAFQGEYFASRYGTEQLSHTPPLRQMLQMGVPVGAGTDATRVASYNPWTCLYWLVTGKTVGGLSMYPEENRLSRAEALRLWTRDNAWFSSESGKKGSITAGQLADFALLSADYMRVPAEDIRAIESVLTVLGGRCVYAAAPFSDLNPPLPAVSPDWSPAALIGGSRPMGTALIGAAGHAECNLGDSRHAAANSHEGGNFGCGCAAF